MILLSSFYESIFARKVYKIALSSRCTCPNRDGTKGINGCIFCSQNGSGDFIPKNAFNIEEEVNRAKEKVEAKLSGRTGSRKGGYIAYFQNFSATYADASFLKNLWTSALNQKDMVGLSLATRPDCLTEEVLSIISDISKDYFVQIELGLQTSNSNTASFINRCYPNTAYTEAISRIRETSADVHIVTHLILGLPNEKREDMLESVKFVIRQNEASNFFGIKITSLYVLKGTALEELYKKGLYEPLTKEKYLSIIKDCLPLLSKNCVVHRLTGDPPHSLLVAPMWTKDKRKVLNEIQQYILQKNS